MRGETQNKKVLVRGEEVFIGVDVHKESWHVTARTEEKKFSMGVFQVNTMLCKTFLVTSRIAGSRLPMKQVPAVSGYMTDLPKMG